MESLLRAQEVAKLLGLRPSTVYALVQRGELPHVRIGGGKRRHVIRFRQSDLEVWIQERTVPAKTSRVRK